MHIAEPLLQAHDVLAIGGEAKMAGLDDAGMHRADRHLKDALPFHLAEFVPDARKRRQRRVKVKILAQRMDVRPVVVQGAAPRIRVAQQLQAKQVLHLPLLPVHGVDGIGERVELGLVRRHRHAQ